MFLNLLIAAGIVSVGSTIVVVLLNGYTSMKEEAKDNTSYSSPHTRSQIDMIINHHLS